MSILGDIKQQKHSLDDLAKLPQSMIMQMAQRKEILPEMVAPILSRKAEMMDAVAQSKALQGAQQGPAPTVLESLMAKNAQAQVQRQMPRQMQAGLAQGMPQGMPPSAPQGMPQQAPDQSVDASGLGQLQPMPQMAGGGMVAFAKGDYVDGSDDQDPENSSDDMEFKQHQARLNRISSLGNMGQDEMMALMTPRVSETPSTRIHEMVRNSVAEKTPEQSSPEVKEVTKERVATAEPATKGMPRATNHPYAALVAQDAQKYGNDPATVLKLLNNETGGLKHPETAVSPAGATGIAQFMPATAKQYGIDPTDPVQSSDAMNKHVHHLMKEYGDPQLVAIAYNWGEGNTNRWLKSGANPRMLPKETQNYVSKFMNTALAKGGEVMSYAEGGLTSANSYASSMKRAFGYEPFHGPTVHKYMSGGEVKHFDGGGTAEANRKAQAEQDRLNLLKPSAALLDLPSGFYNGLTGVIDYGANAIGVPRIGRALGIYGNDVTSVELPKIGNAGATPFFDKIRQAEAEVGNPQVKPTTSAPKTNTKVYPKTGSSGLKNADQATRAASATQPEVDAANQPPPSLPIEGISDQAESNDPTMSQQESTVAGLANANPAPAQPKTEAAPEDASFKDYMDQLGVQRDNLAKQRQQDKALALMMTGAAIAGGESPYAMQNIGKGTAYGLGYYADARKEAAIEEARINQSQGVALRAKNEMLLQRDVLAQRKNYQDEMVELRKLQEKDNKSKADNALEEKKAAEADKQKVRLEKAMTGWGTEFMRPYTLKAQLLQRQASDLSKTAITEEDKQEVQKLENKALSIIDQGQSLMSQHPLYIKNYNTLFPEMPLPYNPPAQAAPEKPKSKVDTSKFTGLNF